MSLHSAHVTAATPDSEGRCSRLQRAAIENRQIQKKRKDLITYGLLRELSHLALIINNTFKMKFIVR